MPKYVHCEVSYNQGSMGLCNVGSYTCNFECESYLDRQPTQRLQSPCDRISPSDTVDKASGRVMCSLELVGQFII